jgi:hypothetical protein
MAISFKKVNGETVRQVSRKKAKTPQERAKEEIMQKVDTFTADQLKAFNILIDKNIPFVYLGGSAGTGKSYTLTTAVEYMRRVEHEWVAVTATTATAALLIEAQTVHKFFGFKPDLLIDEKGKPCARATKKIKKCSVIVIDEVSMARCDLLSSVIASIKKCNKARAKEGLAPMRLILCGDPCQLPSVLPEREKEELEARLKVRIGKPYDVGEGWFFNAPEWDECNFKCIELKEVMRQKGNIEFIENLNRVRVGDNSNINWFNHNCSLAVDNPPSNVVSLFPYNRQVRAYNKKKLSEMDGEEVVYTAELGGLTADDVEDNGYDYELRLKPGCLVMMKQNPYKGADWCEMLCSGIDSGDYINYFCNGSVGIYRGSYEDEKGEYLAIELQDSNNRFVKLYRKVFDTFEYVEINGRLKKVKSGKFFKTFPCVLSFAISVHKSQGASLPAIILDPKSFASGMLYVGLSRVKGKASSIYLTDMVRPEDVILSDEVKLFLERIRKEDEEYSNIGGDFLDVHGGCI